MNRLLVCLALLVPLTACSKLSSSLEEAGAAALMEAGTPTASGTSSAKPAPPANPEKACVVTPTKLIKNTDGNGSRVGYKMKNASDRTLTYCHINILAYDKSGTLLGQGALSDNFVLEAGAERDATYGIDVKDKDGKASIAETPGAGFEAIVSSIAWQDKSDWRDDKYYSDKHEKPKGTPVVLSAGGDSAPAGSGSAKGGAAAKPATSGAAAKPAASGAAKPPAKK